VTSKADDFGVRYDDGDANAWDTSGFRRTDDKDFGPPTEAFTPSAEDEPDFGPAPVPGYGAPGYGASDYGAPGYDAPGYGEQANGFSPVSGYRTQQLDAPSAPARRGARHGGRGGGPGGPGGPRGPRAAKPKVKGSWWRRWTWRKVLGLIASLIGALIIAVALVVVYIYNKTPVPTETLAALNYQPSMIYAADGKTFIGRFGTENHQNINYNQIPPQIIYSVLAAEDRSFFSEGGVSPTGILRAAYEDTLGGGNTQGGSTITQQFVRQYYQGIGTAQTASRKIKEIFVSMKIARSKSKEWILENYLNTIYLGEGSNGIAAAARTYFNIPVARLSTITWAQAAMLAAIIQQPTNFPLPQYHADLVARWHYVLNGLVSMGKITQAQAAAMTFPKFGEYVPNQYGTDVWDPYIRDEVKYELEGVFHYTDAQLANGGYKIITTIDPVKMKALYAAVQAQEDQMKLGGEGLQKYMHVGAVLENPQDSSIEAIYPGPGFPGARYNGVGHVITDKECSQIDCKYNMAVYNREQVGSSFKPYILATAVSQGMNVKTSMLDGQDYVCIPPDSSLEPSLQSTPPDPATFSACKNGWSPMTNDSSGENGAYSPQDAMTYSVNTAYADLWHYVGGTNVLHMAATAGVNILPLMQGGSGLNELYHGAGVALGDASLTVGEQATFLSALANGGTYHQIHIVKQVSQGSQRYALNFSSHPLFNQDPTMNQNLDSQVQWAMQQVVYKGTAAGNGMNDGRQIISKTGTTNSAQSAFFMGAIPQEALTVAIFTNHQSGLATDPQTLNGLGGIAQNFGGTWPAAIWHTYAESNFAQLQAEPFPTPVFTGTNWILAPKNLLKHKAKHKAGDHNKKTPGGVQPTGPVPSVPTPTATCGDVITVACNPPPPSPSPTDTNPSPGFGTTPGGLLPAGTAGPAGSGGTTGAAAQAGAAVGAVTVVPATLLLFRRLERKRAAKRKQGC